MTTDNSRISITAQSKTAKAPCPHCGLVSWRIQSYYWRKSKELEKQVDEYLNTLQNPSLFPGT